MFLKPIPQPKTPDLPQPEQVASLSYQECRMMLDNILDCGIEVNGPQFGFLRLSFSSTPRKDAAHTLLGRMEACIMDDLRKQDFISASGRMNEVISYRKSLCSPVLDPETLRCAHTVLRRVQIDLRDFSGPQ